MADDLSLQPLQISGMMPLPTAAAADPFAAPPAPPAGGGGDDVAQLKAMFPDFDGDVLSSVLAMAGGDLNTALEQLLEMSGQGGGGDGGGDGGGGGGGGGGPTDEDEQLAQAMFQQFALEVEQQLNLKVPDEIRADMGMYQAFVASALADHEERIAAQGPRGASGGSSSAPPGEMSMARIFDSTVAKTGGSKSRGGMAGFLDAFRGKAKTNPIMSSTRVIAVGDERGERKEGMKAGLLDNASHI